MKAYHGCKDRTGYIGVRVYPHGYPPEKGTGPPRGSYELDPRLDEVKHSPDGFNWGYGGSGPSQLAYAILRDHLGDRGRAQAMYQAFKTMVIANIRDHAWILAEADLDAAILNIQLMAAGTDA